MNYNLQSKFHPFQVYSLRTLANTYSHIPTTKIKTQNISISTNILLCPFAVDPPSHTRTPDKHGGLHIPAWLFKSNTFCGFWVWHDSFIIMYLRASLVLHGWLFTPVLSLFLINHLKRLSISKALSGMTSIFYYFQLCTILTSI